MKTAFERAIEIMIEMGGGGIVARVSVPALLADDGKDGDDIRRIAAAITKGIERDREETEVARRSAS